MKTLVFDVEATTHAKGNPYSKYNSPVLLGFKSSVYGHISMYRDFDFPYIESLFKEHDFIIAFNLKYDFAWLRVLGFTDELWFDKRLWDTQLYYFLEKDQTVPFPSLDLMSEEYGFGKKFDYIKENYWNKGIDTLEIPKDELIEYNKQDLNLTEQAFYKQYKERLGCSKKFKLFRIHQEDQKTLIDMEYNGLHLDVDLCYQRSKELEQDITSAADRIKKILPYLNDVPINLNSPPQKSALLFGGEIKDTVPLLIGEYKTGVRKGQPKYKNTEFIHQLPRLVNPLSRESPSEKGVYSTDAKILKSLKAKGVGKKVIDILLERQKLEKLKGTYYEGWINRIDENGWEHDLVHPTYNQCRVITGRLSSEKPNAQNPPSQFKEVITTRYESD